MFTHCEIHEQDPKYITVVEHGVKPRGKSYRGKSNLCTVIANVERDGNVNEAADKIV